MNAAVTLGEAPRVAVIGAGQVGRRVLTYLLQVFPASHVVLVSPRVEELRLPPPSDVALFPSLDRVAVALSAAVLCCAPTHVPAVAAAARARRDSPLILSLVAGVGEARLRALFSVPCPLYVHSTASRSSRSAGGSAVHLPSVPADDTADTSAAAIQALLRDISRARFRSADQGPGGGSPRGRDRSASRSDGGGGGGSDDAGRLVREMEARAAGVRAAMRAVLDRTLARGQPSLEMLSVALTHIAFVAWNRDRNVAHATSVAVRALACTARPHAGAARATSRRASARETDVGTAACADPDSLPDSLPGLRAACRWAARQPPVDPPPPGRAPPPWDKPSPPAAAASVARALEAAVAGPDWAPPRPNGTLPETLRVDGDALLRGVSEAWRWVGEDVMRRVDAVLHGRMFPDA